MNKPHLISIISLAGLIFVSAYAIRLTKQNIELTQVIEASSAGEMDASFTAPSTVAAKEAPGHGSAPAPQQAAAPPESTDPLSETTGNGKDAQDAPARDNSATWLDALKERMQTLKENNPEAYRKERERQDRVRNQIADALWEQMQFVEAINTENLTKEYLANHEVVMAKLRILNEKMESVIDNPNTEQGFEARAEMVQLFMSTLPMLEKERHIVLYDLGRSMGYDETQASRFAETIEYVNTMTSPRLIMQTIQSSHRDQGPMAPGKAVE